jgi:endonuclease YncB( thermonuclease family)
LLFALCSLFFANASAFAAATVSATVNYIVDGDTFSASVNLTDDVKISVRVRIIDIDAPELHGECDREIKMAHDAKRRLGELLPDGATVSLSEIKDDKYLGRIDARVRNASGTDVGHVLVGEKLARKYSGKKRGAWCSAAEIRGDTAAKTGNAQTVKNDTPAAKSATSPEKSTVQKPSLMKFDDISAWFD